MRLGYIELHQGHKLGIVGRNETYERMDSLRRAITSTDGYLCSARLASHGVPFNRSRERAFLDNINHHVLDLLGRLRFNDPPRWRGIRFDDTSAEDHGIDDVWLDQHAAVGDNGSSAHHL